MDRDAVECGIETLTDAARTEVKLDRTSLASDG
jgi:hypothetical protein